MPRAQQRTGQLREHIVQVAVAMLAADGVGGFTTRKVAEQARTSPPAVCELFGDEAGLVREVFSRPFADFDPGPAELEAGAATREYIVHRVQRCIDAGIIDGDQVDIAHGLLALAQGLAVQEAAGWLGSTRASVDRRWDLAVRALLAGLSQRSGRRDGS